MLRTASTVFALALAATALGGCGGDKKSQGPWEIPDGSIWIWDGAILLPDGNIVYPDGATYPIADGSIIITDGGFVLYEAPCRGVIYACGNLQDDDGDGKIDAFDPDCLGPCHNNEAGFDPMIPGGGSGTGSCTLDCYFDSDSGSGGDDCEWHVGCDPLNPGALWPGSDCSYIGDPNGTASGNFDCAANRDDQFGENPNCEANCAAWTPNGCDCFGCCYFDQVNSGAGGYVHIGSKDAAGDRLCTLDVLDDPTLCNPCTPVASCQNECGRCELCLGRDPATIPPDCFTAPDSGTDTQCPAGVQPCGLPGQDPCSLGYYCTTGCCIAVPD